MHDQVFLKLYFDAISIIIGNVLLNYSGYLRLTGSSAIICGFAGIYTNTIFNIFRERNKYMMMVHVFTEE